MTPGDVAEIIVFGATRRENVVLADSLVFPSHQVGRSSSDTVCGSLVFGRGQRLDIVTARVLWYKFADCDAGCFYLDA